jgi:hypothetical protein
VTDHSGDFFVAALQSDNTDLHVRSNHFEKNIFTSLVCNDESKDSDWDYYLSNDYVHT